MTPTRETFARELVDISSHSAPGRTLILERGMTFQQPRRMFGKRRYSECSEYHANMEAK